MQWGLEPLNVYGKRTMGSQREHLPNNAIPFAINTSNNMDEDGNTQKQGSMYHTLSMGQEFKVCT